MGLLTRGGWRRALASVASGVVLAASSGLLSGCKPGDPAIGLHAAHGVVEDVDRENAQVLIDHGDIEGLMPAMTMNFAVPDPQLLARLARGQVIDFEVDFTGRSYDVVAARVVGEGSYEAGWRRLGDGLVRSSPVPDFELVDQAGKTVVFSALGDLVLLVDFVYTRCPGPCPVQTSRQVAVQRRIPESLQGRVRFLSLSLDPEHDRPAELLRYATERGADLSNWSFLTGPSETLAELARAYGVGSLRKDDGSIDHTLVTFLVHDGRVLERYLTQPGSEERLLADVVALASVPALPGDSPVSGEPPGSRDP